MAQSSLNSIHSNRPLSQTFGAEIDHPTTCYRMYIQHSTHKTLNYNTTPNKKSTSKQMYTHGHLGVGEDTILFSQYIILCHTHLMPMISHNYYLGISLSSYQKSVQVNQMYFIMLIGNFDGFILDLDLV